MYNFATGRNTNMNSHQYNTCAW